MKNKEKLSSKQHAEILETLKARFEKNLDRHKSMKWEKIHAKLEKHEEKLWSLYEMERTGGEPDVISYDDKSDEYIFYDCSAESPKGRRSICYDKEALASRDKNKPEDSAIHMAEEMGIKILTEQEYRKLQESGEFDLKTSSWIETPEEIRKLGGALFCDRRFDTVFVYHNGADSYYASRGFRGSIKV